MNINEIKKIKKIRQIKQRPAESHKGDFGHVLIIAGSKPMAGAAVLCTRAALKSGAGLVTMAVPEPIYPITATSCVEAMSLPLPATVQGMLHESALHVLLDFIRKKNITSIVMGPGLGREIQTRMVIIGIINNCDCRGVLDADALNQLAGNIGILKHSPGQWIITPHPGELSRMVERPIADIQRKRKYYAVQAARQTGSVCILKGHRSIITDGKKTMINTTGNPGMATGGSGDVLAGIVGGLLAQDIKPFEAACWGSYVHGRAGDCAARMMTQPGMIAGDIIEYIPAAFKKA
ncbi:MAG: NAD(P)H-hydrate dehydratase [Elusimicrobia bacterium]|nr:NAD(P)H-hydrate dehydratase [Elusimicrobiota bacterium]MBD3412224.1 NAD(P)H-hydrate dehydratase [Elusimicrobiota bacterium]